MQHYLKTFATVVVSLAIINRISILKSLTSESNAVII